MQTILGAGGAIGKVLAKELLQYDERVRLVSRQPEKVNETDELLPGDLTDRDFVEKAVNDSSVVYLTVGLLYNHKVWKEKWPVIMQNVIDACRKYRSKLVFFDNAYMYDSVYVQNLTEETAVRPASKKGRVRAEISANLLSEMKSGNIQAMIVRASDFYGPGAGNSVMLETVFKKMQKGKTSIWLGNPAKIHSMTYVPDAAKATALLGNTLDAYQQVWHLPTTQEKITGKQWIELFAEEMNRPVKYISVSGSMVRLIGLFVPLFRELGEMMYQNENDYFFNCDKFISRFPEFKITCPQEGVREVVKAG